MPGEAIAAASPDEALSELEGSQPPLATPVTAKPVKAELWRAGTLVYTSAGIAVLFFWLLWGDFALSMRDRSVGPTVQLFLKSLRASDFTMTMLLTFLPPAIGLVLSPIVSYKSDRFRSRWGRRIPFLLIPTPIAAVAMLGIAYSVPIGAGLHQLLRGAIEPRTATLIVFGVLWTIFEVAVIISGSVLAGLINDVVPRGRLGRFYGLFRSVSLIDGMIFNTFLLKFAETHFKLMFAVIAAVFGFGFVAMCLKVKEGAYPPPTVDPSDHRAGGFFAAIGVYFRECFSRPYYLWCFAAFTLGAMSFLPVNIFSLYYAKQIGMDIGFYGKLIGASYMTSLVLAYGLGWMVDRYHSLRVGIVTLSLYAASAIWGVLNIHDPKTFGIALVAHTVLSGAYFTATASLGQALLPRSKFAQFASAGGMLTSLTTMLLGPALGFVLDRTDHNYRLTFVLGFIASITAIGVLFIVHHNFMKHGGTRNYLAPGDVVPV